MSNITSENLGIKLIKEADYDEYMENENPRWRSEYVKQGDFSSFDGLNLRYYHASQGEGKEPKGCIVMLHGYCGFWGKFHEVAHFFWQAGFDVFFLEQRGHGYSGRQIDDKDMVHVMDYADYIADVKNFMDKIVMPSAGKLPKIIYAHSMGGAIAALFLEEHPEYFDAAVLSSPMFSIKTGSTPSIAVKLLCAKIRLLQQENLPFPGGKRFDGIPSFETSSARSEKRYNYIFNQRLADELYHTYMMSNGWGAASFKATARLLRRASKVKTPVLLLTAGNDALVNMSGHEKFAKRASNVQHINYEDSKHEIYNDVDEVREKYFNDIFNFIMNYAVN
jgi:hypothetical protein